MAEISEVRLRDMALRVAQHIRMYLRAVDVGIDSTVAGEMATEAANAAVNRLRLTAKERGIEVTD